MAIHLSGEWKISVAAKNAAFDQRVVISGSSNNKDGTYGWNGFGTKTVKGSFGIQIQYEKNGEWHNSLMRGSNVTRSGNDVTLTIQSDDNVGAGDLDFNDLVLAAETKVDDDDYCVWGQVRAYSGCLFNPCELPRLVIDDWVYQARRLHPRIRDLVEPIVGQLPPTPPTPEPDPPPWNHRAVKVEVPPAVLSELATERSGELRRGAFREPGARPLASPAAESFEAASATVSTGLQASLSNSLLHLIRCRTEPARGVTLRVIDYDPGPGESPNGPFFGTGDREVLGQTVTDDWGFYFFCFHWTYPHLGGLKPDVMLQLLRFDTDGSPYVAIESRVSWNIDKLYRKDWCIPAHLTDPVVPEDFDPSRTWQYVGNLPVVRISTGFGPDRGHATSVAGDGTAAYPLHLQNAPFGGTLLLKASFRNHPDVRWYRIRYRTTDNPDGNTPWTFLETPLRYLDSLWNWQTVGPVPATIEGASVNAYPNLENDHSYSHPHGLQYKGYLGTGFMRTGFLDVEIRGYNTGGAYVTGTFDRFTARIDNVPPVVEISPITTGGLACGFVTLTDPSQTIPVSYRVIDAEGHLRSHHIKLFKCHNNRIGGDQYVETYDPASGLHWTGTPEDASADIQGFVTRDLPQVGQFFTAAEAASRPNFVAVSIELWASSRTTDGILTSIHHPRYVEVIGVKLE